MKFADSIALIRLSSRVVGGRRFWLAPLLPLIWPAFQAIRVWQGWRDEGAFEPVDVQVFLIGLPLTVLAIALGGRVIAGELDRRTLEIAYTVPGGAHRVWLAKLAATSLILVIAELLMAGFVWLLLTSYPPATLYGTLQCAVFYMVLAMAFAALCKNEITGAMVTVTFLIVNAFMTGFGGNQSRLSPFFNPLVLDDTNPADLIAWTLQNRLGFVLAIAAVTALAFSRAQRREKMLGG